MASSSNRSAGAMTYAEEHSLREKTRSVRGETRETLTGMEKKIEETLAMAGGTAETLLEQREQMRAIQKDLDQTKAQADYAEKQLDRLSFWHFTGKRGNRRRAREELKRRGPAGGGASGNYRTRNDLEATRKARAVKAQQKKEREARRSGIFRGLFARAMEETPPSPRNLALNRSLSSSSASSGGGGGGGGGGVATSRKASLKDRLSRSVSDDALLHHRLGGLGASETVILDDDEEEPHYALPPFSTSAPSVMDPTIRAVRQEKREHDQAVGSSLDQINRGVDALMAVGTAMNVELRGHAEALEGIQASANEVTEQTQVNNTRAARFLRRRF